MKVTIQSNVEEWGVAIIRFAKRIGVSMNEALRIQGRYLAERLIRFTPPDNQGQGRDRVRKDIKKVFLGEIDDPKFQKLDGKEVVRLFTKKDGFVYGVDKILFRPEASFAEMKRHHDAHRVSNGTVTKAGNYQEQTIGRWKFINRMVVTESKLEDFIQQKQDNVGMAKGGWASAAIALKGRVSNWIAKWKRAGRFEDALDSKGYLLFQNNSPWGRNTKKSERIASNALASRARDINRSLEQATRNELERMKR